MSDLSAAPVLVRNARAHGDNPALVQGGVARSYAELLQGSAALAGAVLGDTADLGQERVAFLLPPGFDHVAVQWAIWRAGGVAVPLAVDSPAPELARALQDCRPRALIASPDLLVRAREAAGKLAVMTPASLTALPAADRHLPAVAASRRAMIVYTSGTTAQPKGVVSTHASLNAQIRTLVRAWEWSANDRILHVLPLHHVHGIVNALCCALAAGACCEFHAAGDADGIWERLCSGDITVFMAVPTLYRRLIVAWERAAPPLQARWSAGAAGLRLMVSGSAALPVATLQRWQEITGHRLLERYGMTEIGMALGNPLHGERRAGTVGQPFPGVAARIVDEAGEPVAYGVSGEVQVRSDQVFLEYWEREAETRAAFTADGWFRTGDEATVNEGYWRILGRRSTDIIKSGGYKLSALEIEEALREHAGVADAAVLGVADPDWGERVCAAVSPSAGCALSGDELRRWSKGRLAPYKVPKQILVLPELPRNALGKVTKARLRELFASTRACSGAGGD